MTSHRWLILAFACNVLVQPYLEGLENGVSTSSEASRSRVVPYRPSDIVSYILANSVALGYKGDNWNTMARGCDIWKTTSPISSQLGMFLNELKEYTIYLKRFQTSVKDIREEIRNDGN